MLGTSEVVRLVAQANPETLLTEEKVRRILRRGQIPTIRRIAGRLVWSQADVELLAAALKLRTPSTEIGDIDAACSPAAAGSHFPASVKRGTP